MNERLRNNELVITLSNINNLINSLEDEIRHLKATDKINQLLYAYDIKTKILQILLMYFFLLYIPPYIQVILKFLNMKKFIILSKTAKNNVIIIFVFKCLRIYHLTLIKIFLQLKTK